MEVTQGSAYSKPCTSTQCTHSSTYSSTYSSTQGSARSCNTVFPLSGFSPGAHVTSFPLTLRPCRHFPSSPTPMSPVSRLCLGRSLLGYQRPRAPLIRVHFRVRFAFCNLGFLRLGLGLDTRGHALIQEEIELGSCD